MAGLTADQAGSAAHADDVMVEKRCRREVIRRRAAAVSNSLQVDEEGFEAGDIALEVAKEALAADILGHRDHLCSGVDDRPGQTAQALERQRR